MSEVCALEIMEKNGMIKVFEDKEFNFLIINDRTAEEAIDKITVPAKNIKIIQKGEEFDRKFRELMQKSGYTCMPSSHHSGSHLFFKKKDIDNFINNLPKEEFLYTRPLPSAMERYIRNSTPKNIEIKYGLDVYGHHFFNKHGGWSYQTQITQLNVIRARKEREKKKEQEAIEFMEQLF